MKKTITITNEMLNDAENYSIRMSSDAASLSMFFTIREGEYGLAATHNFSIINDNTRTQNNQLRLDGWYSEDKDLLKQSTYDINLFPHAVREALNCQSRQEVINYLEKYLLTEYSFDYLYPTVFDETDPQPGRILLTFRKISENSSFEDSQLFYKLYDRDTQQVLSGSFMPKDFSKGKLLTSNRQRVIDPHCLYYWPNYRLIQDVNLKLFDKIHARHPSLPNINREKPFFNIDDFSHYGFAVTEGDETVDNHKDEIIMGWLWRFRKSHYESPKDALDFAKRREELFQERYKQGYEYYNMPRDNLEWVCQLAYYFLIWFADSVRQCSISREFGIFPSNYCEDFDAGYYQALTDNKTKL